MKKSDGTEETIFTMTNINIKDIACVYVGKPDRCMCGCAGTYYYTSFNRKSESKRRGYDISKDEINDKKVEKVYRKLVKNCDKGIQVLDNYIYLLDLNTRYTIYLSRSKKRKR